MALEVSLLVSSFRLKFFFIIYNIYDNVRYLLVGRTLIVSLFKKHSQMTRITFAKQ